MSRPSKTSDLIERASRIQQAIAFLEQKIAEIKHQGEVAPPDCYVARYQAKGTKSRYWYYKLQASTPIFPKKNNQDQLSRYLHLGVSGSDAHINAVLAVARRVQIEELSKVLSSLKESWLDLYSDDQQAGHRVH